MTTNHINNNMFRNKDAYQELGCILDHLFTGSKTWNLTKNFRFCPPCQGEVVQIPLIIIHKYVQEEIQHLHKLLEQCVRFHNAYMSEDRNIDLSSDHYQLHWLHWFCLLWADCRNFLTETRLEWVLFCCISSCWSEGFSQFHPFTIIQLDNRKISSQQKGGGFNKKCTHLQS